MSGMGALRSVMGPKLAEPSQAYCDPLRPDIGPSRLVGFLSSLVPIDPSDHMGLHKFARDLPKFGIGSLRPDMGPPSYDRTPHAQHGPSQVL